MPIKGSVYSIEEDHIDSSLIFCGTEFGVFFSPDSGGSWKELANGLPTIAVRDIAIQRRENDLDRITIKLPCKIIDVLKKIDKNALGIVLNVAKHHVL